MIKAKIKQGRLTLASVENNDDEKAAKELDKCFEKLQKKHENLKIIIDWERSEQ